MYGYLTSGASSPIVRGIRAAEDGGPRLAPGQPHGKQLQSVDVNIKRI